MCTMIGYPIPERETCCRLSVRATFVSFSLFKKTFHFIPAGICRPVNPCRIHTDSEPCSSRPLSFLSRMGKVLRALRLWNFCVLIFSYENCLQKFSTSSSAVFSRHPLTQFSPLKSVFFSSHFSVFRKSSRFRVAFHPSCSRRDVSIA